MRFELGGRRALVTGASAGIGLEIARELAARGAHLTLAARRLERLHELSGELQAAHGVEVNVVQVDLAQPDGPRELIASCGDAATIDVLVNNAGVGMHGDGVGHAWDRERDMIQLNVVAVAELTKHFVGRMRERGSGRVLQVASTASFLPCPGYAAYGATKAFVLHHAEALDEELRACDVRVLALCPGSTNTDFFEISGNVRGRAQVATSLDPVKVARAGVDAIQRGRRVTVPGLANKFTTAGLRLIPRRLQATLARIVLE
ncbi:SDR family oxidoreductase [bacterium]|jgi:short-subunit dehydrogenase|nr:SDR family oxidoreductase [Planctomycetota bacterium]MDB4489405.1 SDR family oxidoreductase [bacterium]